MNLIKTRITSILFAFLFAFALLPETAKGQACTTYFPIKEGVRMEYNMYNKKGKAEGSQWQEFRNVSETGNGLEAEVHMGFTDAKGKNPYEMSYTMTCDGNVIRIDYESLLSAQMMEQYGEMEAEITGTDIEWPTQMEAGMTLPDAGVNMKMSMGAMNMNVEVEMTNRKVEKKETITVPAGTFNCYVVYSDNRSKMMMANKNFPSRTWVAEGVGMVKTESYNGKEKLMSSMVLSSVSQ